MDMHWLKQQNQESQILRKQYAKLRSNSIILQKPPNTLDLTAASTLEVKVKGMLRTGGMTERLFKKQSPPDPFHHSAELPLNSYSRRMTVYSLERAIQKVSKLGTPGTDESKSITENRRISQSLHFKY